MASKVRKRDSIELLRILLDGEWHDTHYLALAAGKFIPPEVASRHKHHGTTSVDSGRSCIIYGRLQTFFERGRVEKRRDGHRVEWKLKNIEWAKKMLLWAGALPTPSPIPEMRTLSLPIAEYNVLSQVKQAYEKATGKSITWEAFLVQLLGFGLAGGKR